MVSIIAMRALVRMAKAQSIRMPRQIRSILILFYILGILFLMSAAYSPSHTVSAAYAILNFLTLICVVEFISDVYRNPPNWLQCIFQLRLVAILLALLVIVTLCVKPDLVVTVVPGAGLRLVGGAVAPTPVIFPTIAIISAYAFLQSLEPKIKSILLFMTGLIGTLITQSRGGEIALFLSLALLGLVWTKTSRRMTYFTFFFLITLLLLSGVVIGTVGGERVWHKFNRGEDAAGIASASGRTEIWEFVIRYCIDHPQGMGYEAGFKILFRQRFALGSGLIAERIGATHNSFIDILADAGWVAFLLYLYIMFRVVSTGWRFAKKRSTAALAPGSVPRHIIQCAMILLFFCFVVGMDTSEFSLPMRHSYYLQNIIIAIILGISSRNIVASRFRKSYR